jgi:hypothetical protein
MPICHICGARFNLQSAAWGGRTCGDCIAAEIELGLIDGLLQRERRPVRRLDIADADTARPSALEALEGELIRRVGNG